MPDLKETAEFLAKVPLFKNLKKRQIEGLAKVAHPDTYEAGQEIVTQGKSGVGLFIIVSGYADVIHMTPDGEKTTVNTFGPTDFFGELALLSEGPRTATVIAAEPTEVLVLTRWNFLGVLKSDAEMAITILEELAWRFRVALNVL